MSYWLKYELPEKLVQMIEEKYTMEREQYNKLRFERPSPTGLGFSFTVSIGENLNDLLANLEECYHRYDVSTEAYLWLDSAGHGKYGAPHDMKDVYEDMKACREYIMNVYAIINVYRLFNPSEKNNKKGNAELTASPGIH